ncbi:MAG: hypothetical protein OEL76_17485 [Siculibacillus sp.]|nr:hypothetical protein [Siculibacillus sp.]
MSIEKSLATLRTSIRAFAEAAGGKPGAVAEKSLGEIEFECATMDAARLGIRPPTGPDDLEGIARVEKTAHSRAALAKAARPARR